ncbi:MAG: Holliday junction resolvase RuvX [Candidatus Aerophobetes bacterium]|nr:Holliday junction resolvase RuvX [Candidatus Aerophobetes bacterium]
MRILGLDVGDRKIGVAVSDLLETIAQGVGQIRWNRLFPEEAIRQIKELTGRYKAEKIVVGLPKTMGGEEGFQAKRVREFARNLSSKIDLPLILVDERLSTAAAKRVLKEAKATLSKRKKSEDKIAAAVILQTYLDSQKY